LIGLVVFLIVSAGDTDDISSALDAEADDDPSLPGEFVDLIAIYGGPHRATAGHVDLDVDFQADGNSNPPVGGPHWSGGCGEDPSTAGMCGPAPWGIFEEPWAPETLVHNMEHGGAVLWYNTTDQSLVGEMQGLIAELLEEHELIVMAPFEDMEPETIALTSWSRIDKFSVDEYSEVRVREFMETHVRRFNPEHF